MRWCCGDLSSDTPTLTASPTPTSGVNSNSRRQQLTIYDDHVVLDVTASANRSRESVNQHSSLPSTSAGVPRIRYGPMVLQPSKLALFVTSSVQTSPLASTECTFLETLRQAGWQIHLVTSTSATNELIKRKPVIVILDNKLPDLHTVSKHLNAQSESEDVLFVVLSDRVVSEKRVLSLCNVHEVIQTSSIDISICELFAKLSARLRAIPALFAVVEEAQQPIKICDEHNVIQFVNRAYELTTGLSREDVLGTNVNDLHRPLELPLPLTSPNRLHQPNSSDPNASVNTVIMEDTAIESTVTPEYSESTSTAMPIFSLESTGPTSPLNTATGGAAMVSTLNNSQLFNPGRRRSSEWHCITVPGSSVFAPQYVYVKRGSADGAICRDLSLKTIRSNNALVDAPITEALTVLTNVLHKCDDETQPMVRDAIKILSSTELYAPSITRFQNSDRIASGYYDGLIRLHHPSRQRKRSVVDAFRDSRRSSATDARRRISNDVVNVLESEHAWKFDVIELERVTNHHPLSHLGVKIFERWDVADALHCSSDAIARWFQVIEANYQATNPYHNATHAADVLQATSFFLNSDAVASTVQNTHAVAALIAATVHDLDHPGRGNVFLMNTQQSLALLYNDNSVLENHHVALAFQLTLTQPGINIFARMTRDEFTQMRQSVIDMVLATDMSRHFEYLTKFQQMVPNLPDIDENREANSMTVCRMMIKCADIANPTREWKMCHQWAMRIVEEYFDQTSEEKSKGLPITMKGFERDTCNVPMTQCTFVDMFAREAFTLWCDFAELPELPAQLETNYETWKQMSASWDLSQNVNLISKPPTTQP